MHSITFGNESYLNQNAADIAWQGNVTKQHPLLYTTGYDRNKMIQREMEAYQKWATLQVPVSGSKLDIKYYRLELRINPDTIIGKYIQGKVTTYFTTAENFFGKVVFDFANPLICDSVYYHGTRVVAGDITRPANILEITIPVIPAIGTLDSVLVYYKGVPPAVPDFGGGTGYVKTTHNGGANNYVYTLSEPYSSSTWWPCKSFVVNDKADSLDMIITTPVGFKAAGNGTLISETTIGSNVVTYWKHRYPIAAYQVCTAVANYEVYPPIPAQVNINGTNMPFYNYLFPETNTAAAHTALDNTKLMLTTFSSKFGDYPFKKEKYGHYTFGFGGGMEHNTFSGMHPGTYDQATDWDIIAHELGHQWFGANVTCGSWKDIWLNESFATFSESICAEFAPSVTAGQTGVSRRAYHKNQAININNQSQSIYVSDSSSITTIFSPAVYVYERGAMVLYMLRTLLGDTKFFQAIISYQTDPLLKYGSAITADVKRHMENVSGLNLAAFFNQWIYNTGFAEYNAAKWNNAGTQVFLQLPQTTKLSSLPHFDMPVAVRIQGVIGDTTIVVYDNNGTIYYNNDGVLTSSGSNIVQYNLSFVPTTVTFDAFSQVLANGSFTKYPGLVVLATGILDFTGKKELEHARLYWSINNVYNNALFEVERSTDAKNFEKIGTLSAGDSVNRQQFSFTDPAILHGTLYYRIKVIQKDGSVIYTKLVALSNITEQGLYTISPNPAHDFILINSTGLNEKIDIKMYDAAGRLMKKSVRQPINANSTLKMMVSELSTGTYFVEILSSVNGSSTKQIVIQSKR